MKTLMLRCVLVLFLGASFTMLGLFLRGLALEESVIASEPLATVPLQATGGADVLPRESLVTLIAPEGVVDLRDFPAGAVVRFTATAGQRARVVDFAVQDGKTWYLVKLVENESQGWVPAEAVAPEAARGSRFANFQFCLGNARGPIGPCGDELPLPQDGLWLRWHYSGLETGDVAQRVLLINGQPYASPPQHWAGPSDGAQLANLLAETPRTEGGVWMVRFLVNGKLAAETSVTIEMVRQ